LTFQNTISYIESRRDAGELSYAAFSVGDRPGTHFLWCLDGTTESTLFDMASVTKIAVTTSLFLLAQSEGHMPGTHVVYCCNGFNLLGKLIKGLYGDTLDVLFREKIAPARKGSAA